MLEWLEEWVDGQEEMSTFLFESNDHEAPIMPAGPGSDPLMPLANLLIPPPCPATHLIPDAPSPRYISAVRFSMAREVRREVSVMSKAPGDRRPSAKPHTMIQDGSICASMILKLN